MPTENEFDFGEPQETSTHPALDAVNSIKTTKRYNTNYASGDKETAASIKKKEDRMWNIIGSHSIGANDTGARIRQIAKEDPQLYAELMQLSTDIQNYYKNQHGNFYNFWKRAGQELDVGAANSSWNMATRILSQKNNIGQHAYLYGLGDDTVQQNATNNSANFSRSVLAAIDNCQPGQLVDILHKIKKYYDYEVKVFESLPDTTANQNALNASLARIYDYISAWQKCQTKINQYSSDTAKYKAFLTAYLLKPITPLSSEEQTYINEVIRQLSTGQTLRNAQSAADFAIRVNEKLNPLLGGE